MARIEGEIVIGRPVDVVFDYVADERNEPTYNPRMLRVEKITDGPIGTGTRFRAQLRSRGRPLDMLMEVAEYERPTRLASTTRMSSAEIRGALMFEPVPGGTRMRWSWQIRPRGVFALLTPLVAWLGRRQEEVIWAGLRRHLEAQSPTPPGPE